MYVEDDFNNASEDDDYRELSHESDIMGNLWQIPRRALLVEAPVLKVPATHPHQHPDLVRFRCSVC